jgi:hypothetical protein
MKPVAAVGGDFLDDFELADSSVGLHLGDVSRKGLPAAFFSSPGWRSAPRACTKRESHPAMQYAVGNASTRKIQISSAGMPGPCDLTGKGRRLPEL